MNHRRWRIGFAIKTAALCLSAGLLATTAMISAPALAQAVVTTEGKLGRVSVALGHSQTVRLPASYSEVLVGSAEVADVLPVSDTSIYLLGKQIGTTNVAIFDGNKKMIGVLDVEVTPDLRYIQTRIRESTTAASGVRVGSVGGRIVLNGSVPDASTAERAVAIAAGFAKEKADVINALQVAKPQQVLLEVRVIEASRDASRELGVRWSGMGRGSRGYGFQTAPGTGVQPGPEGELHLVSQLISNGTPFGAVFANIFRNSSVNVDVTLQALEEKGLVRRLANPNLTALSGSTANFLAGGEFPVPVTGAMNELGQAQLKIEFKKFGVMLDFTPTVLEDGVISLRVTPEVSELDYANAVRTASILIPSLIVRRASTELVIKSGQSFAIAGLLQQSNRTDAEQVPWLGTVPVLGALFRSQAYRKQETELVIIVTPHLARPAPPGRTLASPLDKTLPANDLDFFAMGKFELKKDYRHYVETGIGVVGPYGHVLDVTRTGKPVALRVRN